LLDQSEEEARGGAAVLKVGNRESRRAARGSADHPPPVRGEKPQRLGTPTATGARRVDACQEIVCFEREEPATTGTRTSEEEKAKL
jgi:hypothetical protein